MQNHKATLDTVNMPLNLSYIGITMALTEELKRCKSIPLQIIAEGNQIITTNQTTTVSAIVATTSNTTITGALQPLPQFDQTNKRVVA